MNRQGFTLEFEINGDAVMVFGINFQREVIVPTAAKLAIKEFARAPLRDEFVRQQATRGFSMALSMKAHKLRI